jgi:hypothetical protein
MRLCSISVTASSPDGRGLMRIWLTARRGHAENAVRDLGTAVAEATGVNPQVMAEARGFEPRMGDEPKPH